MTSKGLAAAVLLVCTWTFSEAQSSCKNRCGMGYYRGNTCQCDFSCLLYGECCRDYERLCTSKNSCKGRCGETFKRGRACSCDVDCVKYNQCCPDFRDHCSETGPTPEATEQPIGTPLTDGNGPGDSLIPTVNPTFYQNDDPDSASKQTAEGDVPDPGPLPEGSSGFGPTVSELLPEDFTSEPPLPDLDGFEIPPEPPTITASRDETTPSATTVAPSTAAVTGTAEEGTAAPEEGTAAPEEGTAAPEEGTAAPEEGTAAPEEVTAAPEVVTEGTAAAEEGTAAAEEGTAAPEEGTAAPEEGTAAPEEGTAAPEEGTAAPEEITEGTAAPEEVTEVTAAPEEGTAAAEEVTEGTTAAPEEVTEVTAAPEEGTAAAEEGTAAAEEGTAAPEAGDSTTAPEPAASDLVSTPDPQTTGTSSPPSETTTLLPEPREPTAATAEDRTELTTISPTTTNTNQPTTAEPQVTTAELSTLAPVEVSEMSTIATTTPAGDASTAKGPSSTSAPTSKPAERPFKPALDPDNKPVLNGLDDSTQYPADDNNDMDLCSGRPIGGVTTLSNGTVVVFRGHYFWVLDANRVPGPARGIAEVWGVRSPIDTVFTRCNCQGKTYIFKGPQYWRYENDVLDPGFPKVVEAGFDGLRGHITAALSVPQYNRRRESVYFFKRGGSVQKYSYQFGTNPRCGSKVHHAVHIRHNRRARQALAQVSLLGPSINYRTSWRGFPTTITAAVSIPNKREPEGYSYHVFSRAKSYKIRIEGERPVIVDAKHNTSHQSNAVFKCPRKLSESQ